MAQEPKGVSVVPEAIQINRNKFAALEDIKEDEEIRLPVQVAAVDGGASASQETPQEGHLDVAQKDKAICKRIQEQMFCDEIMNSIINTVSPDDVQVLPILEEEGGEEDCLGLQVLPIIEKGDREKDCLGLKVSQSLVREEEEELLPGSSQTKQRKESQEEKPESEGEKGLEGGEGGNNPKEERAKGEKKEKPRGRPTSKAATMNKATALGEPGRSLRPKELKLVSRR